MICNDISTVDIEGIRVEGLGLQLRFEKNHNSRNIVLFSLDIES